MSEIKLESQTIDICWLSGMQTQTTTSYVWYFNKIVLNILVNEIVFISSNINKLTIRYFTGLVENYKLLLDLQLNDIVVPNFIIY